MPQSETTTAIPVQPVAYDTEHDNKETDNTDLYESPESEALKQPHLITLQELMDLVSDLDLSKEKAELLGSCL